MGKFIDRSNYRYGRLTVVKRIGTDKLNKPLWECVCDCGKITAVNSTSLQTGNTLSCGCYKKERVTIHGGYNMSSYNTWRAMIRRCVNPKDKDYPRYGGIGVTVCARWMLYDNFRADMGEPVGDETLDRIDTYGNYELSNCRWAGVKTQNRNVRVRPNSKTGVIGVAITSSGKYMAKITANKKPYYSRVCKTLEEAVAARKELERIHWADS